MKNDTKKCFIKDEVNVMPTIESIEYEKVSYIKEMGNYLDGYFEKERRKLLENKKHCKK